MIFDYASVAAAAAETLAEFGATAILKTSVTGARDPNTGIIPTVVTSNNVTVVVFAYPEKLINGKTILQGDQQVYMSAVGLTMPKAGDVLTWQGADYQVITVKPIAPAGIAVLVEVQARK